jgi:hypothetical protein
MEAILDPHRIAGATPGATSLTGYLGGGIATHVLHLRAARVRFRLPFDRRTRESMGSHRPGANP